MKWKDFHTDINKNKNFLSFVNPTISLNNNATIFTIGSCFARNIEDILKEYFVFPVRSYRGRSEEYRAPRARGILNKFTPRTILRELEWLEACLKNEAVFDDITSDFFLFKKNDGACIDIGLRQFVSVSTDRFFERRKEILNLYSQLSSSHAIILTLGNLEQWYWNNKPAEQAPTNLELKRSGSWSVKFDTFDHVLNDLEKIIGTLVAINPNLKIILTVSPVPMERTFQDKHIVLANMEGKINLWQSAQAMSQKNKNVYYFPSYEMINSLGPIAMESRDWRHVKNGFVTAVCGAFLKFSSKS